jgi:hypothetical protein
MQRAVHGVLVLLALLGTACSAPRSGRLALEPIDSRREVPLSYRTGWGVAALDAGAVCAAEAEPSDTARIRVTFVTLTTDESEALLGPIGGRLAALEVSPADLAKLLETVRKQRVERLIDGGAVVVAVGRPGEVRVTRQVSTIAAFELTQRPGEAIADPVIDVAEEGCLVRLVRRAPAGGGTGDEFSIEFVASTLEHPIREHALSLPGSTVEVTIQAPAFLTQRVETGATLSSEKALLLAGIPSTGLGETMLVALRRE